MPPRMIVLLPAVVWMLLPTAAPVYAQTASKPTQQRAEIRLSDAPPNELSPVPRDTPKSLRALPKERSALSSFVGPQWPEATIEDAIRMIRIQHDVALDSGAVGIFSPDGRAFATVTWRGDLARNVNVYSLLVLDLREGLSDVRPPQIILTRDFAGDPDEQHASPFEQLTFLGDNRTIAFLSRQAEAPAQVYTVDIETKQVRQLTHHPTPVKSFVVGPDGALRAFSAVADSDERFDRKGRLAEDGVFLWDRSLFDLRRETFKAGPALDMRPRLIRQYFVVGPEGPKLSFDSRQSRPATPLDLSDSDVASTPTKELHEEITFHHWATLTGDPFGRSALLFPYGLTEHPMHPERYAYYRGPRMNHYAKRVASPYGLVDLATGRSERLLDAPHPQFDGNRGGGDPVWSLDGRSVVIYTLLPLNGSDATAIARAAQTPPQWVEVDIASRGITPLHAPPGWRVVRWDNFGTALILNKGDNFGLLRRRADKSWGDFSEIGRVAGLNSGWNVATNGRVVIGVKDALLMPPELVAFDLTTKQMTVLTDLNPELRQRRYGTVESFRWAHKYDQEASGFLIKPVGFKPGARYPLVILLGNSMLSLVDEPFLLDAVYQLSGHAIQMLAAQGFVVLYSRQPRSGGQLIETSTEGERMREHIESAIAELDRAGLIDPRRVGLSGWSRAGYHTDYLLIHASLPFAAATQIDGGAVEYNDGMRPFTDEELKRIRTPLLFQTHGLVSLVLMSGMADRLQAHGKPTEILHFPTASHSTTRPQHRQRSLGTHIDWWRFWLKGEEDPVSEKAEQYARWRKLREVHKGNQKAAASGSAVAAPLVK